MGKALFSDNFKTPLCILLGTQDSYRPTRHNGAPDNAVMSVRIRFGDGEDEGRTSRDANTTTDRRSHKACQKTKESQVIKV